MAGRAKEDFASFVASRQRRLQRTAWVMTGDWAAAEDLVQTVLAKAWRHWDRVATAEDVDAYLRRMLVNAHTSGLRRRWRGERPTGELPEPVSTADLAGESALRVSVAAALGSLPARQRAVLALRFLEDCSEARTAALLGCSPGTVKALTAKALARLRAEPGAGALIEQEQS